MRRPHPFLSPPSTNVPSALLDGAFDNSTTRDFTFTPKPGLSIPAGSRPRAYFWVQPVGPMNGDGSISAAKFALLSSNLATVALVDGANYDNGDDLTNGALLLSAPVTLGQQYYLDATTDGGAGPNFFFVVSALGGNSGQLEAEPNDSMATANHVVSGDGMNFPVDGDLSSPADTDWFTFTGPFSSVAVTCSSLRAGSGVLGLTAQFYSASAQLLGTLGPETANADRANYQMSLFGDTSKIFLSIHSAGFDPSHGGHSYSCTLSFS